MKIRCVVYRLLVSVVSLRQIILETLHRNPIDCITLSKVIIEKAFTLTHFVLLF